MTMAPEKYSLFLLPFQQVNLVTLTIEQRHGNSTFLCLNEKIATGILYKYVADWWDESGSDNPIPDDQDAAIEIYFDDHPQHEGYEIKVHDGIHCTVEDKIYS